MKIRFENTIDDFVALARHHSEHSSTARRARTYALCVFSFAVIMMITGLALKFSDYLAHHGIAGWNFTLVTVLSVLLGLLGVLVYMPVFFRRQAERHARRTYAEGNNKAVLGPRELQIVGDELVSRSTYAESRMRIEAVERVVSDGPYTFIYINAATAYVIPHEAVLDGDHDKFADVLRQRISAKAA